MCVFVCQAPMLVQQFFPGGGARKNIYSIARGPCNRISSWSTDCSTVLQSFGHTSDIRGSAVTTIHAPHCTFSLNSSLRGWWPTDTAPAYHFKSQPGRPHGHAHKWWCVCRNVCTMLVTRNIGRHLTLTASVRITTWHMAPGTATVITTMTLGTWHTAPGTAPGKRSIA